MEGQKEKKTHYSNCHDINNGGYVVKVMYKYTLAKIPLTPGLIVTRGLITIYGRFNVYKDKNYEILCISSAIIWMQSMDTSLKRPRNTPSIRDKRL